MSAHVLEHDNPIGVFLVDRRVQRQRNWATTITSRGNGSVMYRSRSIFVVRVTGIWVKTSGSGRQRLVPGVVAVDQSTAFPNGR